MPSELARQQALSALSRERDAYTSAVARANDQLRLWLSTVLTTVPSDARLAEQLGEFGGRHLDRTRFADVFTPAGGIPAEAVPTIRYAQHLLTATLTLGDEAFWLLLPEGADLRDATQRALATLGRVFAAAHTVAAIRARQLPATPAEPQLAPLPPERWSKPERGIAPPLVIELNGRDLRIGGFEALLQGAQKIVLLVNDAAPPAALVRLITPNVFVMQCGDTSELSDFTRFEGAGIAAVIPDAIHFVHDPDARDTPALRVLARPAERAIKRIGAITPFQQMEEVRWLDQLLSYEQARMQSGSAAEVPPHEPGEQLAAWLLKQAALE